MISKYIHHTLITAITLIMISFIFPTASQARHGDAVSTAGRLRIEGGFDFGVGLNRSFMGYTAVTNTPVNLSGGGGAGYHITVGYGISKLFDFDITAGTQKTENKTNLLNGGARFDRKYLLGTLKLKIPFKSTLDTYGGQIKIGVGIGQYSSPIMIMHYIDPYTEEYSTYNVEYEPASGYHATLEFEAFVTNDVTVTLGLRAYSVQFTGATESYTGNAGAVLDMVTDFEDLNGTGIDFRITISRYFL